MNNFIVKANSIALYEAFKSDVEKIGWKAQGWFPENKVGLVLHFGCKESAFFFAPWSVQLVITPCFALDSQYGQALDYARQMYEKIAKAQRTEQEAKAYTFLYEEAGIVPKEIVEQIVDRIRSGVPFDPTIYASSNPLRKPALHGFTFSDAGKSLADELRDYLTEEILAGIIVSAGSMQPKFKPGQWVRDVKNNKCFKILKFIGRKKSKFCYQSISLDGVYWSYLEEALIPYEPMSGEYYFSIGQYAKTEWISICNGIKGARILDLATINITNNIFRMNVAPVMSSFDVRPATLDEITRLDSELEKQGKRFDKEKCELVDIPKERQLKIGDMAIFWDDDKEKAICTILSRIEPKAYTASNRGRWKNAIPFLSVEKYKEFLKQE